jgi:hypothetical protein
VVLYQFISRGIIAGRSRIEFDQGVCRIFFAIMSEKQKHKIFIKVENSTDKFHPKQRIQSSFITWRGQKKEKGLVFKTESMDTPQ